jgi:uncharacterized glyoxalase superfamily protein PhnB
MTPVRPDVACEKIHPTLTVADITQAVSFYQTALGFSDGFVWGDPPTFAGVNLGETQLFLRHGTPQPGGCSVSFVVGNADELYEFHRANGVEVALPPGDRDYGLRDYSVRDLYGHWLSFGHYIYNVGPRIEIERVDVPVRLERRLAALLNDLAAFKHMTIGSLLEETLLHTFEPLGEGVASPHTKRDLRHIQALKEKHGIDYDCHASYRFAER